ncbi:MAG: hypothetical protein ACM3PY_07715 [Omnitrophica WOR_2 bacterium]
MIEPGLQVTEDYNIQGKTVKQTPWTLETLCYILVFILAVFVRFLNLGKFPLTDAEANWALQALNLARSQPVVPGAQPLYTLWTSLVFMLLGNTNFLARFLPALCGCLLVLSPWFFRRWTGRAAALVMAACLALDPGLIALSRIAGGSMPAVAFGILALGAIFDRRLLLAGVLGGLALLSGPAILLGIAGLGIVWAITILMERAGWINHLAEPGSEIFPPEPNALFDRRALYFLIGTVILTGTLFFRFPQGLGAMAGQIPAYFNGWTTPSGVPALRLPVALLVYQPLALIFGLSAMLRCWLPGYPRSVVSRRLCLWVLVALGLAMLYPGRQVTDLAWVLVPLWALAGIEIVTDLASMDQGIFRLVSLGQALLLFLLLVFSWLNLAGLSHFGDVNQPAVSGAIFLIFGAILMATITTVLVGLGWSWDIARKGLVWGLSAALGIFMLSTGWGMAQLRPGGSQELWGNTPSSADPDLLLKTLGNLSEYQKGMSKNIDIVSQVDAPSLRWVLRNWSQASFVNELSIEKMPSIVITYKDQNTPSLAASYRGEEFAWQVYPAWKGILPPDLPLWLTFRQAPLDNKAIILWARADIFPGGTLNPSQQNTPGGNTTP